MKDTPRTQEEHAEFIRETARLSMFFASEYHKRHPEEDIGSVLVKRTSIWEILGVKDSEDEKTFTAELADLYAKTADSPDFEQKGMALLEPRMELFLVKNPEWEKRAVSKYNDSCVRYDNPSVAGVPPNHCNFHITNYISPKSILKEESYTAACLSRLMDDSEKEFGCDTLRTGTWLNSVPQWLRFFPEEWTRDMSEPRTEIHGHLGCWGQIITARKTFNFKSGEHIRRHVELQFKPRSSQCSFESMRRHLSKFRKG